MKLALLLGAPLFVWQDPSLDTYYPDSSSSIGASGLFVLLAGFVLLFLFIGIALYVVLAVFQMRLMKAAGHRTPGAAWVPFWNSAALLETAGIGGPWAWVGVLTGAFILGELIPFVGILLVLAAAVVGIMLLIWVAKAVQAGTHLTSTGGIVLAVLLPLIWLIWISARARRTGYDQEAAITAASTFPIRWFAKVGDRRAPFTAVAR